APCADLLGRQRLRSLAKADIEKFQAALRAMLNWAIDQKLGPKENPASKVRLNKLRNRERFLDDGEFRPVGQGGGRYGGRGGQRRLPDHCLPAGPYGGPEERDCQPALALC